MHDTLMLALLNCINDYRKANGLPPVAIEQLKDVFSTYSWDNNKVNAIRAIRAMSAPDSNTDYVLQLQRELSALCGNNDVNSIITDYYVRARSQKVMGLMLAKTWFDIIRSVS